MNDKKHLLELPFGQFKFAAKSLVVFIAMFAGFSVLSDYSVYLKDWQKMIYAEKFALPVIFILFLTGHLIYELILRQMRLLLEATRSDPMELRRLASLAEQAQSESEIGH